MRPRTLGGRATRSNGLSQDMAKAARRRWNAQGFSVLHRRMVQIQGPAQANIPGLVLAAESQVTEAWPIIAASPRLIGLGGRSTCGVVLALSNGCRLTSPVLAKGDGWLH